MLTLESQLSPPNLAPCGNYFPTCKNFHISHVGILLIRIALEVTDVILHFALKARLGGEPRESFIIMQKVYFEGSLKSHGIAVTVNRCAIGESAVREQPSPIHVKVLKTVRQCLKSSKMKTTARNPIFTKQPVGWLQSVVEFNAEPLKTKRPQRGFDPKYQNANLILPRNHSTMHSLADRNERVNLQMTSNYCIFCSH